MKNIKKDQIHDLDLKRANGGFLQRASSESGEQYQESEDVGAIYKVVTKDGKNCYGIYDSKELAESIAKILGLEIQMISRDPPEWVYEDIGGGALKENSRMFRKNNEENAGLCAFLERNEVLDKERSIHLAGDVLKGISGGEVIHADSEQHNKNLSKDITLDKKQIEKLT